MIGDDQASTTTFFWCVGNPQRISRTSI